MSKQDAFIKYLKNNFDNFDEEEQLVEFLEPMVAKYEDEDGDEHLYYIGTEKEIHEFAIRHAWYSFCHMDTEEVGEHSSVLRNRVPNKENAMNFLGNVNYNLNNETHSIFVLTLVDDVATFAKKTIETLGLYFVLSKGETDSANERDGEVSIRGIKYELYYIEYDDYPSDQSEICD